MQTLWAEVDTRAKVESLVCLETYNWPWQAKLGDLTSLIKACRLFSESCYEMGCDIHVPKLTICALFLGLLFISWSFSFAENERKNIRWLSHVTRKPVFSYQIRLKLAYSATVSILIRALSWDNLFSPYANNKGEDQPVHPRSLISTFVARCLDSITPLVVIFKISRL